MGSGTVFNIQKFCIHDGDGIRTCVFLKGCPLRCVWCHNPESFRREPTLSFTESKCTSCGKCSAVCSARTFENGNITLDRSLCVICGKCIDLCLNDANEIIGREMSAAEVMDEVFKDRIFYESSGGGMTVSGGEPSFQPEFTLELLSLAKEAGISCAIETSGIGSKEFYEKAAELSATFLFDIKCIDPAKHKKLTGVDNSRILANLKSLISMNADVIIRLPLVPECNDSDEDILNLAQFLDSIKGGYRYAEIMPYHNLGVGKTQKLGESASYIHENATKAEISRWTELFASHGIEVRVSE